MVVQLLHVIGNCSILRTRALPASILQTTKGWPVNLLWHIYSYLGAGRFLLPFLPVPTYLRRTDSPRSGHEWWPIADLSYLIFFVAGNISAAEEIFIIEGWWRRTIGAGWEPIPAAHTGCWTSDSTGPRRSLPAERHRGCERRRAATPFYRAWAGFAAPSFRAACYLPPYLPIAIHAAGSVMQVR